MKNRFFFFLKTDIKHMFPVTTILHDCYCFFAFIMNFSYKKWNKIVKKRDYRPACFVVKTSE